MNEDVNFRSYRVNCSTAALCQENNKPNTWQLHCWIVQL